MIARTPVCQKRATDANIDSFEPSCGCWEFSGPLEEQTVYLATEPSLQLPKGFFCVPTSGLFP